MAARERNDDNAGGVASFQGMRASLCIGALVAGANAALDCRGDQRIKVEFGANEIQHVQRSLLHDLTCRDDFARQRIGGLAQAWFQRASDEPRGVLQAVVFIQQLHRGVSDGAELFGGDIMKNWQGLNLASHDADLTIRHTAVGGGDEDHGEDKSLGRVQRLARSHYELHA
jgi:hypothetical protein